MHTPSQPAARAVIALLPVLLLLAAPAALAVPSFARQTGMACEACHTVWPELTHFGRVFKANGYILDNLKQVRGVTAQKEEILSLANLPPLSIMIQVSDTQFSKALPDTAGNGNAQNGTVAFPQQVSLFYAGKIAPHVGAFLQLTYGSDTSTIGIDNTDIRFTDLKVLPGGQSLIYGLSLNNNPTVQDLWNTTPAFGFPYATSNIGAGFGNSAQIDGSLAQDVAGLTAYVFWNESLYAELGLYRTARQGTSSAGAVALDSTSGANVVSGTAPYWRVAYEHNWGRHSIEGGLYGATFKLFPNPGNQPLGGPTDRFQDVAEDVQYQYAGDQHLFSVTATRIHEKQTLDATYALQVAANANDPTVPVGNPGNDLTTIRGFATYYYKRKIGGTVGFFKTTGSTDVVTAPNSPDTRGWIAELNYMPWLNTKLSLQYTAYNKFNGLSSNYDGAGRNASDNNTLYILAWLSY
jgi:hypothetical protein